ncbi:DNA mismatch repair endonuclease MutL [Bacillus sp. FJAT-45350]|uniref:DNA mismatch repair endonuclease MutL n=1 Tax=Bacillus sp. FJAT-45350 TaxID=2011014 RepID=UPI000BB6842A|nr:DNA mismatch repair endonuclease MutL [Bacillus sp. FJAT-45350]
MGKIVKLDEQLSNKIAAGEVVERPASIVKELVENAIDANSSKILIDVEEGGLSKIRVLDNGDGIEDDDVETAFFRHATSKIKTDKDLFKILTLGFRGEALPSIASVSFVELNTSLGEGAGTKLIIEGGKITDKAPAKSRKGTEVIVSNLFYNTPARLKYLKTVHTELGNISDVINRQALAHPDISFQLVHNGKEMLHTSGNGDLLHVISAIYGRSVAKKMLPLKVESIDFKITGYIAKPEITRASRQYISTFINHRYIRNFPLARAIQDGYHTLLPIGRYPLVVLNIDMDPLLIDVNVHPSKLEVRLSKEEVLTELVTDGIKSIFKETQLIPDGTISKGEKQKSEQISFSLSSFDLSPKKKTDAEVRQEPIYKEAPLIKKEEQPITTTNYRQEQEANTIDRVLENTVIAEELIDEVSDIQERIEERNIVSETDNRVPAFYPIGQMHGTYILAQNENGLYIIDQHAAQERIKYEYFKEKVGQVNPEVQDLLVPITFEFTQGEALIIEENKQALEEVGVYVEPFGAQAFIVRSHPTWLPRGQEEETIKEMIQQVLDNKKIEIKKLREEAAILMSCKAAIKANRHLRQDEMFALLESLRKTSEPFTCPHGRPIIIHISTYEMEKMFKRVM